MYMMSRLKTDNDTRRIGGLERAALPPASVRTDTRRIGGLEIWQFLQMQ